jgi:glycerol-3-phosphate acyltransferase PlsX
VNPPRTRPEASSAGGLPVAVDAMGGDNAPGEIVAGARRAVEELGIPVVLVGPPDQIGDTGGLEVLPASEIIAMDDDPGASVRRKKDSSLVRAAEAVRDGKALAMVSAGNTGAAMASALLRMGRLKGVVRPAIVTPIPQLGSHPAVLLDAGANAECTPAMLVQFAQMGAAYASARYGVESPTVALLSIGEEKSKGTPLVKETHELLEQTPGISFVGNAEGRDLLHAPADVFVTDGFTGNVVLKVAEGIGEFLFASIAREARKTLGGKLGGALLKPRLRPLRDRVDYRKTGGALLLGVAGEVVIAHGRSDAEAAMNAIRVAARAADQGVSRVIASSVRAPAEVSV